MNTTKGMRYTAPCSAYLFSAGFRATLGSDVMTIKLPVWSANLNAFAERFVLAIKSECLNHVVPLGELTFGCS